MAVGRRHPSIGILSGIYDVFMDATAVDRAAALSGEQAASQAARVLLEGEAVPSPDEIVSGVCAVSHGGEIDFGDRLVGVLLELGGPEVTQRFLEKIAARS